jgi:transcriptional regulator with XRE-family HTH domain
MPRPEKPIDAAAGPAAAFAVQLRAVRERSGLTYRELAPLANYSHAHLVRAASGEDLPNWEVTKAFLVGCGVSAAQLARWKSHWEATKRRIESATPWGAIAPNPRGAIRSRTMDPDSHLRNLVVAVDSASIEAGSLRSISTLVGLGDALQRLSQREGPISLRELSRQANISSSNLAGWFSGKVTPDHDLLATLAVSLGCGWREQYELLRCFDIVRQRAPDRPA